MNEPDKTQFVSACLFRYNTAPPEEALRSPCSIPDLLSRGFPDMRCRHLTFLLALATLATGLHLSRQGFAAPKTAEKAKVETPEQVALKALRGMTTNVQFNKDGTVRLVRLSKPLVTDEKLALLKAFSNLDYLAVVCPKVTDAGFAHIAGLTNLDTLWIEEAQLTDAGLKSFKNLQKLERLYLADTQITDAGLPHLASLDTLKVLSLERTTIGDAGLASLGKLSNLEVLLLSNTQVTDAGLAQLAKLTKLRALYLSGCKIQGPGLASLKSLSKLEHLCLNETPVGDTAIEALSTLASLKQVELYRAKLSKNGVAQLRKTMTKTSIYVDPATVASGGTGPGPTNEADDIPKLSPVLASAKQRLSDPDFKPHFQRHVIPLLGRLGCNGRNCHGSFQGRGGFQLSMFGYDFDMDHKNLSERIDLKSPAKSLVLNKPTSADEHEGGLRLPAGDWEQTLLRRWIVGGAQNVEKEPARFVRLNVTPSEIVFQANNATTQLKVVAVWSDGTQEDVTTLTRFETKDESVVEVSADGLVRSHGQGDTHIVSFYDNGIHCTPVIRPVGELIGNRYPKVPTPTKIDELVVAKLKKLGVTPSELSTDEEFLRRVGLDLIGTLPTPTEIKEFTADSSSDKRAKKIEELLDHPAYVTWWKQRLCDLTGSNAGFLGGTEMAQPVATQWRAWIDRRVRDNIGWDEIVAGIVLARSRRPGQTYADFIVEQSKFTSRTDPTDFSALGNPMPHFWFRENILLPKDKALAFGYTFLGVRLDCAQCHKHPYDQWSKQDFEDFTQFFTRVKRGIAPDAAVLHEQTQHMLGVPVKLDTAALRRQSYLRIASEGRPIPWKEIYIDPPGSKPQLAKLLGGEQLDLNDYDDPREPIMKWLRTDPRRSMAKAFVNRIWVSYFNVGIIDPPDDLNLANPPSNEPLLNYLVEEFVAHKYDMKWLHRTIVNSRTYQISWRPNDTNRTDERNFSHAILRRLPAEVAIDALRQATGNDTVMAKVPTDVAKRKIGQHPKSNQTRSIDFSLLIFGKPLRTTNCDCERQKEPTLLQALYVRNDEEMLAMLERNDGWLAQVTKEKPTAEQVDELIQSAYLRILSRRPEKSERDDCRKHIADADDLMEGLRDLMWALLNTQEFITNH
jgi:hypothetical protein